MFNILWKILCCLKSSIHRHQQVMLSQTFTADTFISSLLWDLSAFSLANSLHPCPAEWWNVIHFFFPEFWCILLNLSTHNNPVNLCMQSLQQWKHQYVNIIMPVPLSAIPAQAITEPPLLLTDGVLFGSWSDSFFLQTFHLPSFHKGWFLFYQSIELFSRIMNVFFVNYSFFVFCLHLIIDLYVVNGQNPSIHLCIAGHLVSLYLQYVTMKPFQNQGGVTKCPHSKIQGQNLCPKERKQKCLMGLWMTSIWPLLALLFLLSTTNCTRHNWTKIKETWTHLQFNRTITEPAILS